MSLTPINDFVNEYISGGTSRFHMPGHKGRLGDVSARDITEIKGADSLYEASGIIEESEKIASEHFGSLRTYYSTEGSSQVIKAMLALVSMFSDAGEKKVILAARNVHRAFVSVCALLDLEVVWLYSEDDSYSLCSAPVSAETVRKKLASMEVKPKAVYLTSPDYLGGMQDIKAIAQTAHEAGVPLLVDNAHGAYLHFLKESLHPLDLGADMCCDSAHKTMPCLTGCAYMHISKNAVWAERWIKNARRALSLFGSTSPSYILLQSLDQANERIAEGWPGQVEMCCGRVREIKDTLKKMGWPVKKEGRLITAEPMKIVLHTARVGIKGTELAQVLRDSGIECEYADPDYLVLMPSPDNSKKDFDRLLLAFESLNRCDNSDLLMGEAAKEPTFIRPEKALSIREAMFADSEEIDAAMSEERILADAAIACPPAVPLIICGEIIPEGAAGLFAHYEVNKVNVIRE